jgi:uncharacterized membrane protein (DUF485 family)
MTEGTPGSASGDTGIRHGVLLSGHHRLSEAEWDAIETSPDFQRLYRDKLGFIIPAGIFFVVYYFALPVLVGYAPEFMSTKIVGDINLAYVFALSQFVMAWTVMYLYVRRARRWDREAEQVKAAVTKETGL